MALRKRLLIAAVLAVVLLLIISPFWLRALGRALVRDEKPDRADAVIVLAGDYYGNRILRACELARAGLAPVVLVSGPLEMYGVNEADLAIRFGVERGCPPEPLQPVRFPATSTEEEAREFHFWLRRHPEIRSALLVTSNYHSRRALRTFRKEMGSDLKLTSVAAPDRFFTPDDWWRHREGQKTVFFELSKTLASWIGL